MNSQQRRLRRRLLGRQADDFQSHISRSGKDNFWKFTSLTVGNFEFSIQGSRAHYSKPRELADPKIYTEMEVAIFDSKGNWCVLSDYDSIQTQVQFETYSRTTSVAPYVKVEAIQTMLNGVSSRRSRHLVGSGSRAAPYLVNKETRLRSLGLED
jgi:hypothetical protein